MGALYANSTGTPGTLLYQKATGSGNTGWLAIAGSAYYPAPAYSTFPPAATPLRADSFNRANSATSLGQPDRTDLTWQYGVFGITAVTTHYGVNSNMMVPTASATSTVGDGGGDYARLHYGYDDQVISFVLATADTFVLYPRVGITTASYAYGVAFTPNNGQYQILYVSNQSATSAGPSIASGGGALYSNASQNIAQTAPYSCVFTIAGPVPDPTLTLTINGVSAFSIHDTTATMPVQFGQYMAFQMLGGGAQKLDSIDFYPGFFGDTFRSSIAGTVPGSTTTLLSKMTTGHTWTSFTAGSIGVQTTTGAGVMASHTSGTRYGNWVDCGSANGILRLTWSVVTDSKTMPMFRYSDDSNYWYATTTQLKKRVAGSDTTIGTFSTAFSNLDSFYAVLNGTSIEVRRNNVVVLTAFTDSFNSTATKHGMVADGTGATSTARVSDWRFTPV